MGRFCAWERRKRALPGSSYPDLRSIDYFTTYVVPHSNAFSPAAAWYFLFYLYLVFALYERKNQIQKKITYRSAEGRNADCVYSTIQNRAASQRVGRSAKS